MMRPASHESRVIIFCCSACFFEKKISTLQSFLFVWNGTQIVDQGSEGSPEPTSPRRVLRSVIPPRKLQNALNGVKQVCFPLLQLHSTRKGPIRVEVLACRDRRDMPPRENLIEGRFPPVQYHILSRCRGLTRTSRAASRHSRGQRSQFCRRKWAIQPKLFVEGLHAGKSVRVEVHNHKISSHLQEPPWVPSWWPRGIPWILPNRLSSEEVGRERRRKREERKKRKKKKKQVWQRRRNLTDKPRTHTQVAAPKGEHLQSIIATPAIWQKSSNHGREKSQLTPNFHWDLNDALFHLWQGAPHRRGEISCCLSPRAT